MLEDKFQQAIDRFGKQDFTGAERLCGEILGREPRHAQALHMLGVLRLADGRASEAIRLISRALETVPADAAMLENLGTAYLVARDYPRAEQALRQAIERGAAHSSACMRLGLALGPQGKWSEAESVLRTAANRNPDDPDVHINLGNVLAEQGREEEALACFRRVVTLRPGHADAHYNIGSLLQRAGRFEEALRAFQQALAIAPNHAEACNNLGIVHELMGRLPEAVDCYQRAFTLDPGSVHALSNLGKVFRAQGRLDEADAACEKALSMDPHFVDALVNLGSVRVEQARYQEALRLYEKALALDPHNADAQLAHGVLCLALGDFGKGWPGYQYRPTRLRAAAGRIAVDRALPEDIRGKTVLLLGEQGIGDELFFLRFAARLKALGARLIYESLPKLKSLVERTGLFDTVVMHDAPLPDRDLTYLAGDLPAVLREAAGTWIVPPPLGLGTLETRVISMREHLGRYGAPPYVGITWRAGTPLGQQKGRRDRALCKEVPPGTLAVALDDVPGTILALQRHPRREELGALTAKLGRDVHDLSSANEDLEDMLALLAVIDEYVGVSNTNMHLMAGLGGKARVLVPHPAEWRWMLQGDESPWFPGFAVYRQLPDRDWAQAATRLAGDLKRALLPAPAA